MKSVEHKLKQGVVFFVDLVGSSAVSSELTTEDFYTKYVCPFYEAIDCAINLYAGYAGLETLRISTTTTPNSTSIRYRGDELAGVILYNPEDAITNLPIAMAEVVSFIYALKLFWLASPYNKKRIENGQLPRDLAAGIHCGPLIQVEKNGEYYEVGFAINLAKRVESASRSGETSNIYATSEASYFFEKGKVLLDEKGDERFSLLKGIEFRNLKRGAYEDFKGIDPPPNICELNLTESSIEVIEELNDNNSNVKKRLVNTIGKALKNPNSPWSNENPEDSYQHFSESISDQLKNLIFSHSNYWLLTNITFLLVACESDESLISEAVTIVQKRIKQYISPIK